MPDQLNSHWAHVSHFLSVTEINNLKEEVQLGSGGLSAEVQCMRALGSAALGLWGGGALW